MSVDHHAARKQRLANLALFSVTLIPALLFLFVVFQRIGFPYSLEWGEGAGVNQISRIAAGQPLYSPPDLNFAPLVYTPLYYLISAGLSLLGISPLLAARLLSTISSLASCLLITLIVGRKSGSWLAGWAGVALYLACYSLSDGFYDLARVDSFYIFCLLLFLWTADNGGEGSRFLAAGLVTAMGFWVKQSFLIAALPVWLYLVLSKPKTVWVGFGLGSAGIIIPLAAAHQLTEGWLSFYLFELPQQHGYSLVSAVQFWVSDLLRPLGLAFGLALYYFWTLVNERKTDPPGNLGMNSGPDVLSRILQLDSSSLLLAAFGLGVLTSSWITRSTNGGGPNNVMGAYAFFGLMFGLGLSAILNGGTQAKRTGPGWTSLGIILAGIQLISLTFNPFNYLPGQENLEYNRQLENQLQKASLPGLIPYRSEINLRAGQEAQIHMVSLFELTGYFRGDVLSQGRDIINQIREQICHQKFSIIVLDQPVPWFEQQISLAYDDVDYSGFKEKRISPQLDWQLGQERTYLPADAPELSACLGSIPRYE